MEKIILKATLRELVGKKVKALRREGKVPGVLYGHGVDSTPIVLDLKETTKTLSTVGSSTLVTIDLDGKEFNALVRERQRDVIYRTLTHIDFQALSMTETVRTQVPVHIGDQEVPATKEFGAIINIGLDMLEIECLPQDLPDRIDVDISRLYEIGDSVLVKDLILTKGIQVLEDPETLVVVASAPIAEEELELEVEEVEVEDLEPEVIEKGKLDESEEE
jgi:large subunit ribosomal protein L25